MKQSWLFMSILGAAWCLIAANCNRSASEDASASHVPTIEIDSSNLDFGDDSVGIDNDEF